MRLKGMGNWKINNDFIENVIRTHGIQSAYSLKHNTGLSLATIYKHLKILENEKKIKKTKPHRWEAVK